jgi:hypothetical protein
LASRGVVVQPLHGPRRVLAPRGFAPIKWSPDGRWIAFERDDGLWVAQPDGEHRHRVARSNGPFTWSPDGHTLDVVTLQDVAVVDVDGRRLRRLFGGLRVGILALTWSPDGRRLAIGDGRNEIWVVGSDGRGLRRVTTGCFNRLLGWTRLRPILPRVPPPERVLAASSVATQVPIGGLSADGPRVAFGAFGTATCGGRVVVWTPSSRSLRRFPCGDVGDVELAGSRVAWVDRNKCGDKAGIICDLSVYSATLAHPVARKLTSGKGPYGLRGHGDLLVFSAAPEYEPDRPARLARIGSGHERCGPDRGSSRICTTLRRGALGCCAESVSGGLIATRTAVLDSQGKLVHLFPFAPEDVSASRLDGGRLVVARSGMLEVYDLAFGVRQLSRPLPQAYQLEDVDGGIAVLSVPRGIMLLRLEDGRSFTLAPGKPPRLADLEAPGLYYAYATAGGEGRVVFMPRADLVRQLGGGS